MSGICDVTTMSAGSVELPCLLLCPGKYEKITHSVSSLRTFANVHIWLRMLLWCHEYIYLVLASLQLFRVCSNVSWFQYRSHFELLHLPISWYLWLLIERVSTMKFKEEYQCHFLHHLISHDMNGNPSSLYHAHTLMT